MQIELHKTTVATNQPLINALSWLTSPVVTNIRIIKNLANQSSFKFHKVAHLK